MSMASDLGYAATFLFIASVGMLMISTDVGVMGKGELEFTSPCSNLSEQCEVEESCAYIFLFPKDKVKGCRGFRRTIMIMREQNAEITSIQKSAQQCTELLKEHQEKIDELTEYKDASEFYVRKQIRRLQRELQLIEEGRVREQQTVKYQNEEIEYLTSEKNRQEEELLFQKAIIGTLEEKMFQMQAMISTALNNEGIHTTTETISVATETASVAMETPTGTTVFESSAPRKFEHFLTLTARESIQNLISFEIDCVHYIAYGMANGTHISKFDKSAKFVPTQRIDTDGGDINYSGLEFFKMSGEYYLGITNCRHGSHCVYRWVNGTFVDFQVLSMNGVNSWKMHYFRAKTSRGKMHFIALASFSRYDRRVYSTVNDIDSVIYVLKDGKFVTFQTIATNGARGVTSVAIGNYVYVILANSWSVKVWPRYQVKSEIYRVSADGFYFSRHQNLPIAGASASVSTFHFAGNTYLMDVFWRSGNAGEGLLTQSPLFIWDEASMLFSVHQMIPTHNGRMACPFTVKNQMYIAIINHGDPYTDPYAVIYRRSGMGFTKHQRVDNVGGDSCQVFKEDGQAYVIVGSLVLAYPN